MQNRLGVADYAAAVDYHDGIALDLVESLRLFPIGKDGV